MKTIEGQQRQLSDYKGKVVLVVNVASLCGYTPQYEGLEHLYEKYKDRGFIILGFPANNFRGQEPGSDQEIKKFCSTKYNVTFDMFSKISVSGEDQHPLYKYLTTDSPFPGDIKWNFQKYLIGRDGEVKAKYLSSVKPTDKELVEKIEQLLNEKS